MKDINEILERNGFKYPYLRRDPNSGVHYATILFPTGGGQNGKAEVAASGLENALEMRRLLRDLDAKLPDTAEELKLLLSALARAKPMRRQQYAPSTGWSPDGDWFVHGPHVLGDAPVGQLAVRPSQNTVGEPGQLRRQGSVLRWQRTVAKVAGLSSASMLAICAAFAAPLLKASGRPSFAICLFGRTRSGKSLASLSGASVIGIGRLADLIGWRSTDTAIEERLAEFLDILFVIDDISAMSEQDVEKYTRLRSFAYMLSTNQGKAKARAYKGSTNTHHARHRTIVITSSEEPVSALAKNAKRQRLPGELFRLIDVPAASEGEDHIFDRLPSNSKYRNDSKSRQLLFKRLAEGCERSHGIIFLHYVIALIAWRKRLRKLVNKSIGRFVEHVCDPDDGQEARDLAVKFGLIFAGGALGVRAGLLPWDKADIMDAIEVCYKRARGLLDDDAKLTKAGVRQLHSKLKALPLVKSQKDTRINFDSVDGYRRRSRDGERCRYYIKNEAFNIMLPDEHQRRLVLRRLMAENSVALAQTKGQLAEACPKSQFTWPDGERRRSLCITVKM